MSINKRLINTGVEAEAAFDALQNFEVVTYTGNGGTQKITGYIRKGSAFNGLQTSSASYINIPSSTTSTTSTVSFWMNTTIKDSNYGTLFDAGGGSSANTGFVISRTSTNGYLFVNFTHGTAGHNQPFTGTTDICDGTWHHICLVMESDNTFICYLDGVSHLSGTRTYWTSGDTHNLSHNRLGTNAGSVGASSYGGKIDQVRIFDKALSSSEVTTLYGETYASSTKSITDIFNDGSAVALYQLDEDANGTAPSETLVETNQLINLRAENYTSGSTWTDISGQNNNATLTNPTKPTTESVHFDYADLGAQNQYGGNNVSIEFFIKTTNTDDDYFLTAYNGGGIIAGEMILYVPNSAASGKPYLRVSGSTSSASNLSFDHTVVQNDWTHYVLVYDSSLTGNTNRFTMYVNGSAVTTSVVGGVDGFNNSNFMGDNSTLYIGRRGGGSDYEEMDIKEFRIYSKSLSSQEVAQNYAASAFRYNGTPTAINFLGMAFQPDLVWIKSRSTATNNELHDSLRGEPSRLFSDLTNAENTVANGFVSLDSNGFSLDGTGSGGEVNFSGRTYVAWCWRAEGSVTPNNNTEGSVTSTVSANPDAGFSIVKWTGTGAINTIGHGLSSAPELILIKPIDANSNWQVYAEPLGNNNKLVLDSDAAASSSTRFDSTSPTSSVFTFRDVGISGDFIAYCFHSVDSYQKVGSYTGAVGKTLDFGFSPRFVMIKKIDTAYNWNIYDNLRGGSTLNDRYLLLANTSSSEFTSSTVYINFTSTGISFPNSYDGTNKTGGTYLYLAIA